MKPADSQPPHFEAMDADPWPQPGGARLSRADGVIQPDADPWPLPLRQWHGVSMTPVTSSDEPIVRTLLDHMHRGKPLTVAYNHGTAASPIRQITPLFVFSKPGYADLYLLAWCHTRDAPRTFRVSLLSLPEDHDATPLPAGE